MEVTPEKMKTEGWCIKSLSINLLRNYSGMSTERKGSFYIKVPFSHPLLRVIQFIYTPATFSAGQK